MRQYTNQYSVTYNGEMHRCHAVLEGRDVRRAKHFKKEIFTLDKGDYMISFCDTHIYATIENYDDALDYVRNHIINELAIELREKGELEKAERSFVVCKTKGFIVHREAVYIVDIV